MDKPYKKLTDRQKNILMNGSGDKEIDFSFHSRNGGTRHRRMKFEVLLPTLTVVIMNHHRNIHVK